MCASMADIQSVTAEIRRGKKKERKKKPQGKDIMSASATQGGHNEKLEALGQCFMQICLEVSVQSY